MTKAELRRLVEIQGDTTMESLDHIRAEQRLQASSKVKQYIKATRKAQLTLKELSVDDRSTGAPKKRG